jgi:hypothetical protein
MFPQVEGARKENRSHFGQLQYEWFSLAQAFTSGLEKTSNG